MYSCCGETILMRYFATCPRGLEGLLAEDIALVGGENIVVAAGGVGCDGSLETGYRLNLESRIATRVLVQVATGSYRNEADIYSLTYDIDWTKLFTVDQSIRVYVTAIRSPLKSIEFITLKIKDAICDRFRAEKARRPSVNTKNPSVRIFAFITDSDATLYLDTSGEALYLRGHKVAKVVAPIKENLAAGILRLAGWNALADPIVPLLDPMCGSGTFLLEAVQMALDDAPGLSRETGEFGFENLKSFESALWRQLLKDASARRRILKSPLPIFGSDNTSDAVSRTKQNLAHAGLEKMVSLSVDDLLSRSSPSAEGILIANPPYGERLGDTDALASFYPLLGNALKQHFVGWNCWFLSADTRLPKLIRLTTSRKIPLYNGPLECRLYNIKVIAGSSRKK